MYRAKFITALFSLAMLLPSAALAQSQHTQNQSLLHPFGPEFFVKEAGPGQFESRNFDVCASGDGLSTKSSIPQLMKI